MRKGEGEKGRKGEENLLARVLPDLSASSPHRVTASQIDWGRVKRVLVIRLRSIGDTVLTTPSLIALRRFLPEARIDILLEDWVAPLLDGFDAVDNVIAVGATSGARLKTAWQIRRNHYDVVFNLHGGTTGTFFAFASGARNRVGFSHYQYKFLYNHLLSSSPDFWKRAQLHSAEQHLALLGFAGVPVEDRPKSRLTVTGSAIESLEKKFHAKTQTMSEPPVVTGGLSEGAKNPPDTSGGSDKTDALSDLGEFALFHPAAAFATKQWAAENFARVAEYLNDRELETVAIAARNERDVLERLVLESKVPIITFNDLTLPEITALASKAQLFVGNDSGIAHIAAAVNTPSVVIFGSSNRTHWRPWTDAPNEIVYEAFPCQPCPGDICREFGEPKCILSVRTESVIEAIDRVLDLARSSSRSILPCL